MEAISPGAILETASGQEAIDEDDNLIEGLANCPPGCSKLRVWENQNCLVTTKRIARHQEFVAAAERARKKGWPVHIRSTGGTTVVHRPGILNVSLATVSHHRIVQPSDTYEALLNLIIGGFANLGIAARAGFVANSFCDGRYNVCVDNKKIAGTASRIIRRSGNHIHLCHASIMVYGSICYDVELVREFEAEPLTNREISIASHISLQRLMLPSLQTLV